MTIEKETLRQALARAEQSRGATGATRGCADAQPAKPAADAGWERRRDDRGKFEKALDVAWNATMLAILAICAAIAIMGVLP